jgi:EmrB/QacA subfamily drug resistance transporter
MTSRARGHQWWTLAAMCFGLFLIMLDTTIVNVALPSIQRQLDASPSTLEWTINAYVLSFAVLILLGGKLGDRFGRKRVFLVGLAIFTVMSAACALAPTAGWLVAFRVGQGVGGALMNPLTLSILVATFDRDRLGTAIGIWAGISALALAVGPVVGGVLVQHVDWSAVFWINVPIGVLGAVATLWAVAESRDPGALTLDLAGVALVTGGLFCIVWGLIETTSHAWASPYIVGFLAGGLVLMGLFVAWERRAPAPMIPLHFFRRRAFSVPNMVVALVGLALFGVIFFITLYFQNVKGWSPTEAGLRTLPLTTMVIVIGPMAGRLQSRFSARSLMTLGMLLACGGLVGLSQVTVDSSYGAIWPFYVLMGAGLALTMPTTAATAMNAVDRERAGIASGVVNASRQVGAALGIAILGAVGATLASRAWSERIASLPADLHARAQAAEQLVIGAQGRAIGRVAGPAAERAALESFVDGVHGAMWVAAALTFCAALTAFVGLRGTSAAVPSGAAGRGEVALEV